MYSCTQTEVYSSFISTELKHNN